MYTRRLLRICHIISFLDYNYSRAVIIGLVTLLALFADIFHQRLEINSDLSSATLSRSYDSSLYFVCTSVDMSDSVSGSLRAPTSHLYSRGQLVSLRDLASAVDSAVRSYIDLLFSQLRAGRTIRHKRGLRAGRRVQWKIATVSRGRRVITSRDNGNNISPSAGRSLIKIPLCDNIEDNERSSTATRRGLAIWTLSVCGVGKRTTFLEALVTYDCPVVLLGYFNVHLKKVGNADEDGITNLMASFGTCQRVQYATCGCFALVITQTEVKVTDELVSNNVFSNQPDSWRINHRIYQRST